MLRDASIESDYWKKKINQRSDKLYLIDFVINQSNRQHLQYFEIIVKELMKESAEYEKVGANFKARIRKNARERIMSQKRNLYHFGCPTLHELLLSFNIQPSHQAPNLDQIIRLTEKQVLSFPLEGKVNTPESEILTPHLYFWSYLVYTLYSHSGKVITSKVQEFFITFLKHVPYESLRVNENYRAKVINALDLVCCREAFGIPDLRQRVLEWANGVEAMPLLLHCVEEGVWNRPHIWDILEKGLRSNSSWMYSETLAVLLRITKNATMDELYTVYQKYTLIMIALLSKAQQNSNNHQIIGDTCQVIMSLLQTYNKGVEEYVKMGLGALIGQLLKSRNQLEIDLGLSMLCLVTSTKSDKINNYLCESSESGLEILESSSPLYNDQRIHTQLNTFKILKNIFQLADFELAYDFLRAIDNPKVSLLQIIQHLLSQKNNIQLIYTLLNVLSCLLYFSQRTKSNIISHLQQTTIPTLLESFTSSQNEQIQQKSDDILLHIRYHS